MFFDRDQEILDTLQQRDPRVSPVEALRLLAHRLIAVQSPCVEPSAASQGFIDTMEGARNPQGPGPGR
jgi:hypothetical protein